MMKKPVFNKNITILIIAFFVPLIVGLVFNLSPYLGFGFDKLPGDLGDTRFNIFILEHDKQFFLGEVSEYWSAGFMYPEQEVISLSDNLLGSAPLYTFFRIFGFSIFTSFQLWVMVVFILNYVSAFLLTRYLTQNDWSAGLVAFIFTFSISLASQMGHAQILPKYAIPLAIWALLLWKDKMQWKYFVAAITLLTYQMYCGIYLGFLFVIPFFLITLMIILRKHKEIVGAFQKWKSIVGYGIGIIVNLLLVYKLFAPYKRRADNAEAFTYEDISHSLPEIKSYLSAHPGAIYHEAMENTIGDGHQAFWDHWIFPGWITFLGIIILGVLGTVFIFKKLRFFTDNQRMVIVAGWITFLSYLRVGDYSIYSYIILIPGFSAMRSLTRIINVELLFFGLALVLGLKLLFTTFKVKPYYWALGIMFLLVFDNMIEPEQAHFTYKTEMEERHYALIEKIDHLPKNAVVSYEPEKGTDFDANAWQIDAMLAAQALHLKSINGYSAKAAPMFHLYWSDPTPENRRIWLSRFPEIDTTNIYVVH